MDYKHCDRCDGVIGIAAHPRRLLRDVSLARYTNPAARASVWVRCHFEYLSGDLELCESCAEQLVAQAFIAEDLKLRRSA